MDTDGCVFTHRYKSKGKWYSYKKLYFTSLSKPLLNSFFRDRARGELQTQMLLSWLDDQDFGTPVVLVTHQVNITGLTNVYPRSGEVVILRLGDGSEFKVLGTIAPPQEVPQSQ